MYAPDASVEVNETLLSRGLCGASRPVHFGGVCLVVTKLFNLTQPHVAAFGEKDGQQLRIIRRLVRDLDFPVEILAGPTVREEDGLAMSSRNANLDPEERAVAPGIQQTLGAMAEAVANGERDSAVLVDLGRKRIEELPGAMLDYLEIVDDETLVAVGRVDAPVMVAIAVNFSRTRLIDNRVIRP